MTTLYQLGLPPRSKLTSISIDEKHYQTLRAQFATAGFVLGKSIDQNHQPDYFVERWAQIQYFENLAAVEGFLRQIGGEA